MTENWLNGNFVSCSKIKSYSSMTLGTSMTSQALNCIPLKYDSWNLIIKNYSDIDCVSMLTEDFCHEKLFMIV